MKMITNVGKRVWIFEKKGEPLKPKQSRMVSDEIADKYFKSYPRDFVTAETEKPEADSEKKDTVKGKKSKKSETI